jgi:hypothetical protein
MFQVRFSVREWGLDPDLKLGIMRAWGAGVLRPYITVAGLDWVTMAWLKARRERFVLGSAILASEPCQRIRSAD